jgi:hypothetical protein
MMRVVSAPLPSLDGRSFAMISSTASIVDADDPTVFRYHEQGGLIWGEYDGDTVLIGRFVGSRVADRVDIAFGHIVAATGQTVRGEAHSVLHRAADGTLELVETFGDAGEHVSVCRDRAG